MGFGVAGCIGLGLLRVAESQCTIGAIRINSSDELITINHLKYRVCKCSRWIHFNAPIFKCVGWRSLL